MFKYTVIICNNTSSVCQYCHIKVKLCVFCIELFVKSCTLAVKFVIAVQTVWYRLICWEFYFFAIFNKVLLTLDKAARFNVNDEEPKKYQRCYEVTLFLWLSLRLFFLVSKHISIETSFRLVKYYC